MQRIIYTFGSISGLIIILTTIAGIHFSTPDGSFQFSVWLGYLTMLIAFCLIFIGIKRYRDQSSAATITFGKGVLVGLGIAVVASVIYVAIWEIYLANTGHAYINDYATAEIEAARAANIGDAELNDLIARMEKIQSDYANPFYRLPITFLEIFPVGLIISLISAAILRKASILPVANES